MLKIGLYTEVMTQFTPRGMKRVAGSNKFWGAGGKQSVGTVAGAQSWRQRIQIIEDAREKLRSYERLMLGVQMEQWADWCWRILENEQECESTGENVNMHAVSNVKYSK